MATDRAPLVRLHREATRAITHTILRQQHRPASRLVVRDWYPGCSILAPVYARIWYSKVRHLGSLN